MEPKTDGKQESAEPPAEEHAEATPDRDAELEREFEDIIAEFARIAELESRVAELESSRSGQHEPGGTEPIVPAPEPDPEPHPEPEPEEEHWFFRKRFQRR